MRAHCQNYELISAYSDPFQHTVALFDHFRVFVAPSNNLVALSRLLDVTRQQPDFVFHCADLVLICKDIDDRETQKRIVSIKTVSETKCGTNFDPVNVSPLSGA